MLLMANVRPRRASAANPTMPSNLNRFKEALEKLVNRGKALHLAMQYACYPERSRLR